MWSWKLKEFKVLKYFLVSLAVCFMTLGHVAFSTEKPPIAPPVFPLQVTLTGIISYSDYQEIRTALLKAEGGGEEITLDSEAPGLIIFKAPSSTNSQVLLKSLSNALALRYTVDQKHLSTGEDEITISKAPGQ